MVLIVLMDYMDSGHLEGLWVIDIDIQSPNEEIPKLVGEYHQWRDILEKSDPNGEVPEFETWADSIRIPQVPCKRVDAPVYDIFTEKWW